MSKFISGPSKINQKHKEFFKKIFMSELCGGVYLCLKQAPYESSSKICMEADAMSLIFLLKEMASLTKFLPQYYFLLYKLINL